MSAGKIKELVSDDALAQLDALYKKLGITTQAMIDATAAAVGFNNNIGNTKTLTDFTQASQQAIQAMEGVKTAQQQVNIVTKEAATQTQLVVEAVKSKALEDANANKVLNQVGGTLDQNIKLLVQQKLELKNITEQQKELSKQFAGSAQSQAALSLKTAELTRQSIELKNAISQQSLAIRQQVKDNQATGGSQDQMIARLNQMRKAYNSLSEEERNNAQIGGVLLANIKQLATETSKINEAQGKYNDSVGKYEEAIKSAISQYIPYGRQIIQSVDLLKSATQETGNTTAEVAGLGAEFAGFTIGAFAVGMAAATYYLSQFRDTGQKVEQFMGGLKAQFSNFGKNFLDVVQGKRGANLWTGFVDSFNQGIDTQKQLQDVKNLNEVNDQLIQKQQAQADQYRAQAKNVGLSARERIGYLKEAQSLEKNIVDQQKENAQSNIDAAIQVSNTVKKLDPVYQKLLATGGEGSVRLANDLVKTGKLTEQGYGMLMEGYQRQTQSLNAATMKLIRQQNDEARLNSKNLKELNNEELENQKAKLEQEKLIAKETLDNKNNSYEVRLAALKVFTARSNAIIDNEQATADRKPGITSVGKDTNAVKAKSSKIQVDQFDFSEELALQKERSDELKKELEEMLKYGKDIADKSISNLQEQSDSEILILRKKKGDEEDILAEKFSKGKIEEKKYRDELLKINDQYNVDRLSKIAIEILQAKENNDVAYAIGNGADSNQVEDIKSKSGVAKQKHTVAEADLNLQGAVTQQKLDGGKSDNDDLKKAQKDLTEGVGYAKDLQEDASKVIQAGYENELRLLEKKAEQITENANVEKAQVEAGVGSARSKADKIAQIEANAAAQRKAIQAEEAKIKQKEAIEGRIAASAAIIENTAVAATKVIGQTGIFGLALEPIVIALGAAQLAATLAAPLPKFKSGTMSSPEGFAHVGEAGPELRIDPSGKYSLTPGTDTLTYLQQGTKIISNQELVRMMGKPEQINYVGGQAIDINKLISAQDRTTKAIEKSNQQRPRTGVTKSPGWDSYLKRIGVN